MVQDFKPQIVVDTADLTEDEWLEERKKGIGGSDAAVACGCSPYRTSRELYYDKIGIGVSSYEKSGWLAMEIGNRLESLVAQLFVMKTGYTIHKDTNMYCNPEYPFMIANLDYIYTTPDNKSGILEIKTASVYKKDDWKDDKIPLHYELQVRYYMAVMNINEAWICCLFGNNEDDFVMRHIRRDLFIEELVIQCEYDFWFEFVLKKTEPPLVESPEAVKNYFISLCQKDTKDEVLQLSTEYVPYVTKIVQLKEQKAAYTKKVREIEKQIQQSSIPIMDLMKEYQHAECKVGNEKYQISFVTKQTIKMEKEALSVLQVELPDVFYTYASCSFSRYFTIKKDKPKC